MNVFYGPNLVYTIDYWSSYPEVNRGMYPGPLDAAACAQIGTDQFHRQPLEMVHAVTACAYQFTSGRLT